MLLETLFYVCNIFFQSGESRHLTHIQFTSWPDYGVPRTGTAFLDFLFRVRSCQADATKRLGSSWKGHALGPPIVVHCSAGIGRTGELHIYPSDLLVYICTSH